MELFGVQELPNSKSKSAPGWAYVPDISTNPAVTALQPSRATRTARNQPNASAHENSAKQDAKILRELAALDKESHKDVQIPVPAKHRDNAGRSTHGKVTPAVRKILQSQKTFANHLSDAEALSAHSTSQAQSVPTAAQTTPVSRASPASIPTPAALSTPTGKRPYKKRGSNIGAVSTPLRQGITLSTAAGTTSSQPTKVIKKETSIPDVPMIDVPKIVLSPLPSSLELAHHPGDNDPLLISHIPMVPSEKEMAKLISTPPLTYLDARGELTEEDLRRPTRNFCEICGYWGRVKCMKCGTRVCALDCLRSHQEECYTRYGA